MPRLEHQEYQQIAEILSLIGEPNRLRILLLCYERSHFVSEIASSLNLSLSLVSHHLRLLRSVRILRTEKQGKQVLYTLHDGHIRCILKDIVDHFLNEADIE